VLAVLSVALPATIAVGVAAAAGTAGLAVTRADVVARLRARDGHAGLSDQDVGLVCGGALAAVLGLVALGFAHSGADQVGVLLWIVIGVVTAGRRVSMWRAAQP
jgi:hypothetical protein